MNKPGDLVECIASNSELDIYVKKPISGQLYTVFDPPDHWTMFNCNVNTCIKLQDGHLYLFDNSFFRNISKERDEKLNELLK